MTDRLPRIIRAGRALREAERANEGDSLAAQQARRKARLAFYEAIKGDTHPDVNEPLVAKERKG